MIDKCWHDRIRANGWAYVEDAASHVDALDKAIAMNAEDDDAGITHLFRPCSNKDDPSQWCVVKALPTYDGL